MGISSSIWRNIIISNVYEMKEANLPTHYLSSIESIESLEDEDRKRDAEERAIHS